ncbi:MAG: lipid-A-disaccharide synthase-related protein [Elainella sp.]
MKLLCLSNGHGEDGIALRILQSLQRQPQPPELAALPIVGEGHLYRKYDIPIIGPTQAMPSGGFIYMDGQQLARDLRGGLLTLTLDQLKAVRAWANQGGKILAVGDIVPLLFAWWSGADYAFVGTAKSDYYLRDEQGWLPRSTWFEQLEAWSGSVFLPWERWLMSRVRCRAVFPRDRLTHQVLKRWPIPSFDLGNPMMDGLTPSPGPSGSLLDLLQPPETVAANLVSELGSSELSPQVAIDTGARLTFLLLPGSRSPEAYENWSIIMQSVAALVTALGNQKQLLFLGAIAPQIEFEPLRQRLETYGWRLRQDQIINSTGPDGSPVQTPHWMFEQYRGQLILTRAFNQCLHQADLALAMAGTATEQFVGLGKPALTFPGAGPQFTARFAEAQTRLLGPSVTLVEQPQRVVATVTALLQDPDRLQLIRANGLRRMGQSGAADRIAAQLIQEFQDR